MPSPQSIEQNLLNILQTCRQLELTLTKQGQLSAEQTTLLQQARKQSLDSANQIATLQGQLDSSQASVKDSQSEMSKLSSLLAASQLSLNQLSTDFEAFKAQRDKDVLQLQSERNKAEARASLNGTLAKIGYSALAIFAGYEVYKSGIVQNVWKKIFGK
jgi:chromosome segregation ATPase